MELLCNESSHLSSKVSTLTGSGSSESEVEVFPNTYHPSCLAVVLGTEPMTCFMQTTDSWHYFKFFIHKNYIDREGEKSLRC